MVYGFIASAVVLGAASLDRRQSGQFVFYPAIAVLVLGVLAWFGLGLVRGEGAEGGMAPLVESVLAVVAVGGIEGVMFAMAPIAFMDGAAVLRWSRTAWAALSGVATFLFWQLLVNPGLAYLDAFRETGVRLVLGVAVGFAAVTVATWGYFRVRQARA
jgi:hypothetical protein